MALPQPFNGDGAFECRSSAVDANRNPETTQQLTVDNQVIDHMRAITGFMQQDAPPQ